MKLKETLTEDNLVYEEITKEEAIEKGYWKEEWTTVPQLWLYKQHIGGYNGYVEYRSKGTNPDALSNENQEFEKTYSECAACEA